MTTEMRIGLLWFLLIWVYYGFTLVGDDFYDMVLLRFCVVLLCLFCLLRFYGDNHGIRLGF